MGTKATRSDRTHDETDDDAKHFYADAIVRIKNISDKLAEISYRRKPIDRKTLSWLYSELLHVADRVYRETLSPMTLMGIGINDPTPLEAVLLDTLHETYSDGTPVWTREQRPGVTHDQTPAAFYSGDINLRASGLGGRLPPGCDVIVADPPHRRRARPESTDFKSLKETLMERKPSARLSLSPVAKGGDRDGEQ